VEQGIHTAELMKGLKDFIQTAMDRDVLPPEAAKYAIRVRRSVAVINV
jgi:hypothetical protein